jgi:hypothetical protein
VNNLQSSLFIWTRPTSLFLWVGPCVSAAPRCLTLPHLAAAHRAPSSPGPAYKPAAPASLAPAALQCHAAMPPPAPTGSPSCPQPHPGPLFLSRSCPPHGAHHRTPLACLPRLRFKRSRPSLRALFSFSPSLSSAHGHTSIKCPLPFHTSHPRR